MEPELNNPQFLMALLALEQKLVSQDELLVALRSWLANPSKPLSEILMEQAGTKAELTSVFQKQVSSSDSRQRADFQSAGSYSRKGPTPAKYTFE